MFQAHCYIPPLTIYVCCWPSFSFASQNPNDDDNDRMAFLLSGKGTMPTVTLESPLDRDSSGAVVMNFGEARTQKDKMTMIFQGQHANIATVDKYVNENGPNRRPSAAVRLKKFRKTCVESVPELTPRYMFLPRKSVA